MNMAPVLIRDFKKGLFCVYVYACDVVIVHMFMCVIVGACVFVCGYILARV